jgi:hypothetical protein
MAFYQCFPDSRHLFKDDFKEQITSIVYEWVLGKNRKKKFIFCFDPLLNLFQQIGIRSMPGIHKEWVINDDITLTSANKSNVKVASTNERN